LPDKTVELVVFCRRKINARQTHDLIHCKIVAQFSSLKGLLSGISLVVDSLVSCVVQLEMRRACYR
jgi:hypothetical protein